MRSVSNDNFGPLIAYLLPGVTVLHGITPFSPTLQSWFATSPANAPTIGGFLYLTVASLAAGMMRNAVRWVVVDTIHRLTGLSMPTLDFSHLGPNVEAFVLLIEIHYRHYQFYANMLVALVVAYIAYRVHVGSITPLGWTDLAFVVLEAVFFVTSRDTLRKFFDRGQQLLASRRAKG